MVKKSLLESAVTDEVRRKVLRESLTRFHNELMDDEERQLLLDRIRRLRRTLRVLLLIIQYLPEALKRGVGQRNQQSKAIHYLVLLCIMGIISYSNSHS